MPVAILIPTLLSRPDFLTRCLESVFEQNVSDTFSVYVMCNTPQRDVDSFQATLPKHLATAPNFQFVALGKNTGFTGAVNAGIAQSSEDLVVMLNDDTVVTKDWLQELLYTQHKSGADMVASTIYLGDTTTLDSQGFTFRWRGQALPLPHAAGDTAIDNWKNAPHLLPDSSQMKEPFGPDAAAALYTRHLLESVGSLNPNFFAYLEDVDLALRARLSGFWCALASDAVVYHHKHATSAQFSGFKARKDFLNWWRIVSGSYPWLAWLNFFPLIVWERLKNLSGVIKAGV